MEVYAVSRRYKIATRRTGGQITGRGPRRCVWGAISNELASRSNTHTMAAQNVLRLCCALCLVILGAEQAADAAQMSLGTLLQESRLPLTVRNGGIAGPGAAFLVKELAEAQFVAIGEEHGRSLICCRSASSQRLPTRSTCGAWTRSSWVRRRSSCSRFWMPSPDDRRNRSRRRFRPGALWTPRRPYAPEVGATAACSGSRSRISRTCKLPWSRRETDARWN